ncbi:carboxypeptidase-like regulatory domain-containing protein [Marinimicrobium sp. ABcell2]|uniref:carboxypeptidase-like regulatory domain-containing protein n=1 Tax=Marinimicrobium sp. ABcell2 TaxID=3069751 RepID=UPI0027B0A048|nr:carboxypeptidase-like regulatory domain-containing protein [Marinimicrobium sp. ABcell2]MDQ2077308.1 carboxypeptidase-like regulatory domain-containing protein [Marinimicrobium sp. ABcell2]
MRLSSLASVRGFRRSLLSTSIIAVTFGLSGCLVEGDESTSTSTSNSNAQTVTNPVHEVESERQITGVIQGVLRDRVTGNPIEGAVISIGLRSTETNEHGQYVIEDVPVTTPTSDGGGNEVYQVSIDLREASSGSDYPYPDFYYDTAEVTFGRFTPIEAQEMAGENFQQGTFHQVISGLVSAHDMQVGKLSTRVSGRVVGALNQLNLEPHAPVAGVTVYLEQTASTARSNRVVAETQTDENGNFSFANIEAGVGLTLRAFYEDDYGDEYYSSSSFSAPQRDGQELRFTLLDGHSAGGLRSNALQLELLENQGPILRSVTPENYSDLSLSDGTVEVRYTFNRPVRANNYATALDPSSSAIQGLYADVEVTYDGTKLDHGALRPSDDEPGPNYTLHWESDYTVLVVSLRNLADAARYTVDISGAEGANKLVDSANRQARLNNWGSNNTIANPRVEFTTRGDGSPEVPEPALVYSAVDSVDEIVLQWAPVDHARAYRVYTQRVELNPDVTSYLPGYWEEDEITTARYSTAAELNSSNGNPMAVYFKVTAVNADGIESDYSEVVGPVTDTVSPRFIVSSNDDQVDVSGTEFVLDVSEQIRELADESGASISVLLPNGDDEAIDVVEVVAAAGDTFIEVELSSAIAIPSFDDLANETLGRIRTGWNGITIDGIDQALDDADYVEYEQVNILPPLSTGLCMTVANDAGNLFSLNSDHYEDGIPLALSVNTIDLGDDEVVFDDDTDTHYVFTGPSGVCHSITALLNFYHDEGNNSSASNAPWIDAADADGVNVDDHAYGAAAQWALSGVSPALLGSVTLNVDHRHFRISHRVESLTQLAINGVDEFWTEPTDLSASTLSQLTQNDDRSRPGSARVLPAYSHYLLPGDAPNDPRPVVLYTGEDLEQAHFAWRGTPVGPRTTTVVYEFREGAGTDFDELQSSLESEGMRVLPYSLDEYERSVEILRVAPGAVHDIAGNANSGYTLVRTYVRSDDLSETEVTDHYRQD